jgi:ribosomal protein S12 methylthiotransferase accessory factor
LSAVAALGGLVDGRFGPILDVHRQRLGGSEPRWWLCSASLARYPIGSLFNDMPPTSAGTSINADEALGRAVGEALERYSALTTQIPLVRATLRESGLNGRFAVCAPDEPCPWSFRAPPEDVPITQTPVRHLATEEPTLVPAVLVSLASPPDATEPPIGLSISTGLAFHQELHQAIWRGLCEVIERDAVMTLWWLHQPVSEITLGGRCPERIADRIERLRSYGFHARLYDITTELDVPTVFCVLLGERFPKLVVSAASRADPADACAKALDEVVSMRVALQASTHEASHVSEPAAVRLVNHAQLYASNADDPAFDFLLRDEHPHLPYALFARRAMQEPRDMEALSELSRRLAEDGLSVLWAEVTAPEVAELGFVVRVVVPELVPLSPDDRVRWLGTPRLLRRAGIETATRAAFASYPHPFA